MTANWNANKMSCNCIHFEYYEQFCSAQNLHGSYIGPMPANHYS